MFRRIALTLIITIILALFTGPAAYLAENELTPCDFVQRFNIGHRPTVIDKNDIRWIDALSGFGDATVEALKDSVPIRTVSELKAVNGIGEKKSFLLQIFFNLKRDKSCEKAPDHIVINEFDPSPAEGESEYVELYNPTDYAIDISGWVLSSLGKGRHEFEEKTILPPGSFHLIDFGTKQLNNDDEIISLYDKNGLFIDSTIRVGTPSQPNFSWQRCYNGKDTDSINDWHFKQSTPKANNEC